MYQRCFGPSTCCQKKQINIGIKIDFEQLNFMFKKGLQDSAVTKFRSLKKKTSQQIDSKQQSTNVKFKSKDRSVAEQKPFEK